MKILIVGLGSIAQKHIAAINELSIDHSFYALRSSKLSQNYDNVINLYTWEEVFSIEFDFAIISNPTSEHKNSILKLLDFPYPLFIEKPLYYTLDVEDILNKVRETDTLTYVACNLRFLDSIQYIKNSINNKSITRINEINVYCGSYLPEWRKSNYKNSYSADPKLGGGVHIDLIHEIDYIYWMFGKPLFTKSILRSNSSLGIKSIDYANYSLVYDSFCVNIILNYYRRDYKRTFELVFEDSTWLVDLNKNTIYDGGDTVFKSSQKITDTYLNQMRYFIDLLKGYNKMSFNSVYDTYEVLKIALS